MSPEPRSPPAPRVGSVSARAAAAPAGYRLRGTCQPSGEKPAPPPRAADPRLLPSFHPSTPATGRPGPAPAGARPLGGGRGGASLRPQTPEGTGRHPPTRPGLSAPGRRPRPARLLPRGQPGGGGGGRGARAAAGPLRARRQPGCRCTLRALGARPGPGRRGCWCWWRPRVRGGRGSRQVPPPRLGRRAAVAADGYGNERLCLARSV